MGDRRKSREVLLQLLFQAELNLDKDPKAMMSGYWKDFGALLEKTPDIYTRVQDLFIKIWEKRSELDQLIEKSSENWKISRMGYVDRNILRYACYELFYCKDVPGEVVLDEAIEIAKRYGTEESGSFVNGILDKIWKSKPL